jgi:translation initiation factor 2 beta subunit (eIF-2beta)/eIF-5
MVYLTEVDDIEAELTRFMGNFRIEDHDKSLARDLRRYALRCESVAKSAPVEATPAKKTTAKKD